MIYLHIDSDAVDQRLNEMAAKLRKANHDVPNELFNWQAEDLRRKQPWVRRVGRRRSWQTIIRPHSIREMKRAHAALIKAHRRHTVLRRWSTRPILREELDKRLVERMTELLTSLFKW